VARHRRDTAVDRLTDLSDYHQVINRAPPQRPKPRFPRLGKSGFTGAELAWNLCPGCGVSTGGIRLDCIRHVFVPGPASKRMTWTFKTMIFDD
jgi:hypothetical protein